MINSLFLTASDEGLLGGEIFGVLFIFIFGIASLVVIKSVYDANTLKEKLKDSAYLLLSLFFTGIGCFIFDLEHSLRTDYIYVEGTTVGTSHNDVDFEYTHNNIKYKCSNSYQRGVKTEGGKYWVRLANSYPSIRRIDFDKPIEK